MLTLARNAFLAQVLARELKPQERRIDLKQPRVFITQVPSRLESGTWVPTVNIEPVKEFGEPIVLFPPGMNLHGIGREQNKEVGRLFEFDFDRDYLLLMGDPLLMAAGAAMIGSMATTSRGIKRAFRVLRWDRHQHRYFASAVMLPA